MRDLAFLEDGLSIPTNQLNFRTGETPNNPILTTGTDAGGFTYKVEITPSNTAVGPVTFSFRLTDADGEMATTQVAVIYTATPPIVDLLIEDGFVSGDATVTNFNTNFNVKVPALLFNPSLYLRPRPQNNVVKSVGLWQKP